MSNLEKVSVSFREQNIARNDYDKGDEYTVGHPDALSTGDELGKGEMNNKVGGATDIKTREKSIAKNKYNKNKEYNAGTA